LVLSEKRASTPRLPYSAIVGKSITCPSSGDESILKSPVCRIVPAGVVIGEHHGIDNAVRDVE
jgi:hypothetical protein